MPIMHSTMLRRLLPLLTLCAFAAVAQGPWPDVQPPAPLARVAPYVVKSPHGDRVDEYHWLRDDDPQTKRPEILQHLQAENAYSAVMLAPLAALRARLVSEMRSRMRDDDSTPPAYEHGWWLWTEFRPGAEQPRRLRQRGTPERPDPRARPQLMLDDNQRAAGHAYYRVTATAISPDGNTLAWTEDTSGRNIHMLHFKNLKTGRVLTDTLPGVMDNLAWANDSRTLFYIRQDPVTLNSGPVYRHRLGTRVTPDVRIFEEPDKTRLVSLARSASGRLVCISVDDYDSSETLALSADAPRALPHRVLARRTGVRHDADHYRGRWFVRTNEDAPNFRLVSAPDTAPDDRRRWRTLVPARDQTTLERFVLMRQGIALQERVQADSRVRLLVGRQSQEIPAEPGTSVALGDNRDPNAAYLRYGVESMVQPRATWDLHLATRQRVLRKRQDVPGYDAALYAAARVWAPARDGRSIPVTLAWRPDRAQRDGHSPLLLQAYGAYGISFDPGFSANRPSLLDRGFVVAIAHVRGGAEMGEAWYEAGRLLHKQNSFNDFIDATQALVTQGWADPQRVFASGGSAGGLLMGVVANQAPQMYRGIVLDVPFVDVVTTMLDESIPLTANEWSQWGDPRQKAAYEYMLSYSPYDQLRAQAYPAMLVFTGLWDGQVQYYEPAKYVARLRARKTDHNPLLLKVNMAAGHGGAAGRYEALDDVALEYAFILGLSGLRE